MDYGNVETVSVLDVRVLPKAFLELPFQGISARLSGEPVHYSSCLLCIRCWYCYFDDVSSYGLVAR